MSRVADSLLIVDANHLLHSVLHVPNLSQLKSLRGQKYGGVYGFLRCLRKHLDRGVTSNCLAVWDGGLSARRLELLPEYKGARRARAGNESPEDEEHRKLFGLSRDYLMTMLPLLCVTVLQLKGREGDDVIWAVREAWLESGKRFCGVLSEDKDFCQMVDEQTFLYRPIRDVELNVRNFEEEIGVPRSRYLLFKSLVGDKSDNIPGVPGVGEVTAREIVLNSPSTGWDDVVTFCESHKKVRVRRVAEQIDIVKRNDALVRLGEEPFDDAEVDKIRAALQPGSRGDLNRVQQLFNAMEFDSMSGGFYDWSIPFVRLGAR